MNQEQVSTHAAKLAGTNLIGPLGTTHIPPQSRVASPSQTLPDGKKTKKKTPKLVECVTCRDMEQSPLGFYFSSCPTRGSSEMSGPTQCATQWVREACIMLLCLLLLFVFCLLLLLWWPSSSAPLFVPVSAWEKGTKKNLVCM